MGIWQQRPRDDHATDRIVIYDIETVVDHEPADGSFPPIPQHRPVAAAFLTATRGADGHHSFRLDVPVCKPGSEAAFLDEVSERLDGHVGIGWNSRNFDNSVLRLTAMAHRRFSLAGLARQTQAGRYERFHCDLADQFAGYGATRTLSLASVCEALQIPVKTAVHGSDVGALWGAGDVEAIVRYIAEDVLATYLVWLHWPAWKAASPAEMALPLSDLAVWLESDPALEPHRAFATCPPALWARAQAPALRTEQAIAAAERRAVRERDEAAFASSIF